MLKVSTAGTTVYYVNTDTKQFLRVKGENSVTHLWHDGDWNDYNNNPDIETEKSMFFVLLRPFGAWQQSTPVSAIEEIKLENFPSAVAVGAVEEV